ncbi:MAG: N utilization substance protein B, partial [Pseudomonadota bacterium]|nr:N utilization substance protein B [Pseudomonadota bacterium]
MSEAGDTSPHPGKTGQPKAGDRRRARALAMQGLYQRHFSKTPISDIEAEFMVDNDMSKVDI